MPPTLDRAYNPHSLPRSRPLAALSIHHLQHARATQWIPTRWRRSLGRLRGRLGDPNARPDAYPALPRELRAQLVARFADDTAFVESLLDVDLASWRDVADDRA